MRSPVASRTRSPKRKDRDRLLTLLERVLADPRVQRMPTYGSLIAAINFDLSGTTRIGKYVLNHSFMIPGLVATAVAVIVGLLLARIMF